MKSFETDFLDLYLNESNNAMTELTKWSRKQEVSEAKRHSVLSCMNSLNPEINHVGCAPLPGFILSQFDIIHLL